jgi:parvulin-like peptidyl-prolyl isomerase
MISFCRKAEVCVHSQASAFVFFALLFFAGCVQQQAPQNIVARLNDQTLTLEMIRAQMDSSQQLTQEIIQQYANRWITNELLFQEARQRGLDISDDVQKKLSEARKQLAVAALLEKEVYEKTANELRSDEIAAYYQSHLEEFTLKENLVWISTAVFAELKPANDFRASALGNTGWNESVKTVASDVSKGLIAFSDSLFFTSSTLYPPELWKVATALGKFEVSFPVKTSAGYFVMRSLGLFPSGSSAPLAKVSESIRQRIAMERRRQRYNDFVESLRKRSSIQMYFSSSDSTTQQTQ